MWDLIVSFPDHCLSFYFTMFYKIVYGLVAIPLPSYFVRPEVYTSHMHSLSYRQIHTSVCYYQYSLFPMSVVL